MAPAVVLAAQHWSELTSHLSDQILSYNNLLVLTLSYPVVKALHELGHGLFAKRFGAAVHDCGALFLVFLPMPYVDRVGRGSLPQQMAAHGGGRGRHPGRDAAGRVRALRLARAAAGARAGNPV